MSVDRSEEKSQLLFVGEFVHGIDSQRRVAIPKDWRFKEKENVFYLMPGRHKSLQLMPYASFKKMADKLEKVSIADSKASIALARLGAKAKQCICDKQGRIAMNEKLLEYAEIKKGESIDNELVLVGAFNSIQIWSEENWRQQQMGDDEMLDVLQNIEELPDELSNILKK